LFRAAFAWRTDGFWNGKERQNNSVASRSLARAYDGFFLPFLAKFGVADWSIPIAMWLFFAGCGMLQLVHGG
jgi:hypothetical protein